MIARNGLRSMSHPSVSRTAQKWEAANATGGWQDKRPRGAASVGCVVSIGYEVISRGAGFSRTSQPYRFSSDSLCLARCAEHRP